MAILSRYKSYTDTGVEFKQKLQLASRTSRYKNQLALRYSTSPTIMGTITKNYKNNYFIWKNYNEERMSVLSSLETSSSPASPSSCRKKHIVCKLNMSFGLFHCCELTGSCGFSASLFFFFFWPDHTSFFSPIFHYYLI